LINNIIQATNLYLIIQYNDTLKALILQENQG